MDRNETAALPTLHADARSSFPGAAFQAHALGQDGQRRGLRAGPPLLARAQTAYLSAEWSGAHDRRPAVGRLRRHSV